MIRRGSEKLEASASSRRTHCKALVLRQELSRAASHANLSMSWNQLGADRQQNNCKKWRPFLVMKAREKGNDAISVSDVTFTGGQRHLVRSFDLSASIRMTQTHCDCRIKHTAEDDNANNNTATTYCKSIKKYQ